MTLDGVRDKNLQQLKLLNPAISPVRSPVRQPAHMIQSPQTGIPKCLGETPRLRRRWRPVTPEPDGVRDRFQGQGFRDMQERHLACHGPATRSHTRPPT